MFDPDFSGRFSLFTPSHSIVMLLIAAAWIVLPVIFKNKADTRADRLFRSILSALLVVQYLAWMLWEALTGRFTIQMSLPLNLCDFSNFLCALVLVTRNKKLFEVLYFWALAGTIQSYITPNIYYAFPHFEFFVFYIQHGGEILTILYLVVVHGMRPQPVSILRSFGWFMVLLICVYIFNWATGSNYNFLMADTPQPSTVTKMITLFGRPPRHLIGLGMVVLLSLLLLYSPFAIIDAVKKRRGRSGAHA
jgi:hypothetical integral membrane protein (TIGR02206 family)